MTDVQKPRLLSSADETKPFTALEPTKPAPPNAEEIRLYGAYAIHQDVLSWNRLQAILVVEAGLIAAAISVRHLYHIPFLVLLPGTLTIIYLYLLARRDWKVRDHFHEKLEKLGIKLGIPHTGILSGKRTLFSILLVIITANAMTSLLHTYYSYRDPESIRYLK